MTRPVDNLVLRVASYGRSLPAPENVEEAWGATYSVGAAIDREGLVDELLAVLHGQQVILSDRWDLYGWNAGGAGLEIVIGVTSGTAVLAIEKVAGSIAKRFKRVERNEVTAEDAVEVAKRFLGECRQVPLSSLRVEEVHPISGGGFQVRLTVNGAAEFLIEVDATGVLLRLKKTTA